MQRGSISHTYLFLCNNLSTKKPEPCVNHITRNALLQTRLVLCVFLQVSDLALTKDWEGCTMCGNNCPKAPNIYYQGKLQATASDVPLAVWPPFFLTMGWMEGELLDCLLLQDI